MSLFSPPRPPSEIPGMGQNCLLHAPTWHVHVPPVSWGSCQTVPDVPLIYHHKRLDHHPCPHQVMDSGWSKELLLCRRRKVSPYLRTDVPEIPVTFPPSWGGGKIVKQNHFYWKKFRKMCGERKRDSCLREPSDRKRQKIACRRLYKIPPNFLGLAFSAYEKVNLGSVTGNTLISGWSFLIIITIFKFSWSLSFLKGLPLPLSGTSVSPSSNHLGFASQRNVFHIFGLLQG